MSTYHYCKYCDIACENTVHFASDPDSHKFKDNGVIVCPVYTSNVTISTVPNTKKDYKLQEVCADTISLFRIEIEERILSAQSKYSQKLASYTEEDKIRIANWIKANTPHGKKISSEWQPYLMNKKVSSQPTASKTNIKPVSKKSSASVAVPVVVPRK